MEDARGPLVAVLVDGGVDFPRRLLQGLRAGLTSAGWRVVAVNAWPDGHEDGDLLVRALAAGRVSALVVTQHRNTGAEAAAVRAARAAGVPVVAVGREVPGAAAVRVDNAAGMDALLDHVLGERGARRPVLLQGNVASPDARERTEAFLRGLQRHGLPRTAAQVLPAGFDREPAFRALSRCLEQGGRPDLVVASNDEAALGALDAARFAGLRVPHDLLVTGFDDSPVADLIGLTTVDQDLGAQGRAVAQLLLGLRTDDVVVPGRLVLRSSSGDLAGTGGVRATPLRSRLDLVFELHRTLTGCRDLDEVATELAARLPRLGVGRLALCPRVAGPLPAPHVAVALLWVDGLRRAAPGGCHPEHELVPLVLEETFPAGAGVRTLIAAGGSHGLLVHDLEEDEESRQVAAALQTALAQVVGALVREEELHAQAAALRTQAGRLEELVAARTLALEQEVDTRKAAETQLRRVNVELQRVSLVDELTGLANRRALNRALADLVDVAGAGVPLGFVLLDLDRFKAYNDRYGHQAGDACLARVAAAVRGGLRRVGDVAARYGGEELALVLPGADEATTAAAARAAVAAVRALGLEHAGSEHAVVTVSAGWAVSHPPEGTGHELVRAADQALYRAKDAGRNRAAGPPPWPSPGSTPADASGQAGETQRASSTDQ